MQETETNTKAGHIYKEVLRDGVDEGKQGNTNLEKKGKKGENARSLIEEQDSYPFPVKGGARCHKVASLQEQRDSQCVSAGDGPIWCLRSFAMRETEDRIEDR